MSSLIKIFLDLANLNENFESNYIELSNLYQIEPKLHCKNGLSWARSDGDLCKIYKILTIYDNINNKDNLNDNSILFRWNIDEDEKEFYINDIREKINNNELQFQTNKKMNRYIKVCGKFEEINDYTRQIRNDIKKIIKKNKCVHCGNKHEIECDHKNDLMNNPRVLNIDTQTLEDFQPLCQKCNKLKREFSVKMRNSKKRIKATDIDMRLKKNGIDFIFGDETLDINNPDCLIGTYWYDCEKFATESLNIIKNNN